MSRLLTVFTSTLSASARGLALTAAMVSVLSVTGSASSEDKRPVKAQPKTPGACVSVTGQVRAEAYGFKHVVSLRNGCDKVVECQVWTDVDPTPRHTVRAAPGETHDVVTRIGSPASAVTAHKECRFL